MFKLCCHSEHWGVGGQYRASNVPEAARHEEEVDDHEEDGAAPVLHVTLPNGALLHQVGCGHPPPLLLRLVAGNVVPDGKAHHQGHRDHGEAGAEVDDGPLRVGKAGHVDEEGEEGEGAAGQADHRPAAHPVAGEVWTKEINDKQSRNKFSKTEEKT